MVRGVYTAQTMMGWSPPPSAPSPPMLDTVLSYVPTRILSALLLAFALDLVRRQFFLKKRSFKDKHVLVTGGSQGIGKALAEQLLAKGARVTLLARTAATLDKAVGELKSKREGASVQSVSASITDYSALKAAVAKASSSFGPVEVLVCCAGSADTGLFLHTEPDVYSTAMDRNYAGTVKSIKAVIDGMVSRRDGQIIIVGSVMSVIGFMGYSSYAPTKWALRGLADSLRNELTGFGITIQIAYPPDTDTPGFENENKTKPIETIKMVPPDVFPAESVASTMLSGAEAGLYHLPGPDPGLNLFCSMRFGVSPRGYLFVTALLHTLMPLWTLAEGLVTAQWFDMWGRSYAARHDAEVKAGKKD
jgi:3-dehydrosphinganine reductase